MISVKYTTGWVKNLLEISKIQDRFELEQGFHSIVRLVQQEAVGNVLQALADPNDKVKNDFVENVLDIK